MVKNLTPAEQQVSPLKSNIPICSMYGIFTYIWLESIGNVGKYSMHGASGIDTKNDGLENAFPLKHNDFGFLC